MQAKKQKLSLLLTMALLFGMLLPSFPTAVAAANGPADVQLETPEGYQAGYGNLKIMNITNQYGSSMYVTSSNGTFDLSNYTFNEADRYYILLSVTFNPVNSTDIPIFYLEQQIMTGDQIAALSNWSLAKDANMVTVDISGLPNKTSYTLEYTLTNPYSTGTDEKYSVYSQKKLLTNIPSLSVTYRAVDQENGYILKKEITPLSITEFNFNEELQNSVDINFQLDGELTTIKSIRLDGSGYLYGDVSKVYLTPGQYNVSIDLMKTVEGKEITYSYQGKNFDLSTPKTIRLTTSPEKITESNFYIYKNSEGKHEVHLWVDIMMGDLSLSYLSPADLLKYDFKLVDSNNQPLSGTLSTYSSFNYPSIVLDAIPSGEYKAVYSLTLPGSSTPSTYEKSFIYQNQDSKDINGLLVKPQDEKGQSLQSGNLFLLEKQNPSTWSTTTGDNGYWLKMIFKDSFTNGESFIPNAYLLSGKEYELMVVGLASDGKEILYHRSLTPPFSSGELILSADRLTKLTLTTSKSYTKHEAAITVVDQEGELFSYPVPVDLGENGTGSIYVSSDDPVRANALLYDETKDEGSLLIKEATLSGSEQTLSLDGEMIQITPPSGAKVTVSDLGRAEYYASKFYVSKVDPNLSYVSIIHLRLQVQNNPYQYTLSRWLSIPDQDIALSYDSLFTADPYLSSSDLAAGKENVWVSTTYREKNGFYLDQIEPVDTAPAQIEEGLTFQVPDENGMAKTLRAKKTPAGVEYEEFYPMQSNFQMEYAFFNGDDQKVGNSFFTSSIWGVQVTMPSQNGTYRLKLVNQGFPATPFSLSMEKEITLGGKIITILPPDGYHFSEKSYEAAVRYQLIQYTLVDQNQINVIKYSSLWNDGGVIDLSRVEIDPSSNYLLFYSFKMLDSQGNWIRVTDRRELTGDELLNLTSISPSSQLLKITHRVEEMPFSWNRLTFDDNTYREKGADDNDVNMLSITFDLESDIREIWLMPGEYTVKLEGTDGGSNGYTLSKHITLSDTVKEILINQEDLNSTIPIQLKNPANNLVYNFSRYYIFLPGGSYAYGIGYYYPYDNRQLKTIWATPDIYERVMYETINIQDGETPWSYTWFKEGLDLIGKDRYDIHFTGRIDSAQLVDFDQYRTEDGKIALSFRTELKSGDLDLRYVSVYRERNRSYSTDTSPMGTKLKTFLKKGDHEYRPDYLYDGEFNEEEYISPTILIKDAEENTVYKADGQTYLAYNRVEATLIPGSYTLIYSLPIGPNQEVKLEQPFTVTEGDVDFITLTAPQNGLVTNKAEVQVKGTARPNTAIQIKAEIPGDGASVVTSNVTADSSGSFNAILTLPKDGTYTIQAVKVDDPNVTSQPVTVTLDTVPPAKPVVTAAAGDPVGVKLSWQPDADAVKYIIYAAEQGSDLAKVAEVTDTQYTYTGVTPGKTYLFKVVAYDKAGNSSESDTITFTVEKLPEYTEFAVTGTLLPEAFLNENHQVKEGVDLTKVGAVLIAKGIKGSEVTSEVYGILSSDGKFHFDKLTFDQVYTFTFTVPGHYKSSFTLDATRLDRTKAEIPVDLGIQKAGDINQDDTINIWDVVAVSRYYLKERGTDGKWNPENAGWGDLNQDGIIDLLDLGWVIVNFGTTNDLLESQVLKR